MSNSISFMSLTSKKYSITINNILYRHILNDVSEKTRHVFVKHGCPRWQQSQNMTKISKSHILTLPHPHGHVMSVKYEEPIDELTVKVWLLYRHPNFRYCTLLVSGTELQTNRQTDKRTDRQTDDPITRCPRRAFQAGGIKNISAYSKILIHFVL